MQWKISYYSKNVQEDILSFPPGIKARYIHCTKLMIEFGPNLREPHTKAMGDGLFELRLKSQEGIARVLYCPFIGQTITVLHCFIKKSQKIPRKELETARKRMKEVKKHVNP
ncbi:MAG: type II toxin-antitoxin system RelE/ParE family toxin [Pseudomonadota bacterium]